MTAIKDSAVGKAIEPGWATMYWSLSGRKLPTLYTVKKKENSFLLDARIDSPHSINPQVPEQLSSLVMECVKTSPVKRPRNMNEVATRLETMRHAIAKSTPPPTAESQSVVA